MHDGETVAEALRLRDEEGLGARRVARRLGLPLATVRDWHAGKLPARSRSNTGPRCSICGHPRHNFEELPERYVYLLGLYLGDGSISTHRGDVHKLRVFLDKKYPGIVDECAAAMSVVLPRSRVGRRLRGASDPRYGFSNVSTDLTSIFCTACDCLGLHWTGAFPEGETTAVTIYVSRKADVTRLDEFVGAKA
jgi:hypothetical protein